MFNGLSFLDKGENEFDSFLHGSASNDKSNLADIFEADESERVNELNTTLKYTPLKSTQPQSQPQKTDKSTWNVVIAKIVAAYKLVNDSNTSVGQLGLALLQNPIENASKLILYKTKDQILSTFLLGPTAKVFWKPPYLQYHDDLNGFWSLFFTHDSDCTDFFAKLEQVCEIDRADTVKSKYVEPQKTEIEKMEVVSSKMSTGKSDEVDSTNSPTPKTKSDVVHRVAKIGHQLPKIKPVTADDDSDSTLPSDTERLPAKSVYHMPERVATSHLPPKPANFSVALQPSFWPSSSTFDLNSFATENRMQNTEVRMNLTKLDSKIDRVLDNIERLQLKTANAPGAIDKDEEIIKLEEKVLELKKENRALKLRVTEGDYVIQDTNEKAKELAELQTQFADQERHISELKSKWQETEQNLKIGMDAMEKEKAELIENHTKEVATLRAELEKKHIEVEAIQQQLKEQQEQSNKSPVPASNGDLIRGIMNQFYVKLYQSLEGTETMAASDVLKLTAEIIRKETKAALNSN